ncbi:hypothetical protein GGR57DRAFT_504879 [Xylariaceae sp. FL1272]|nr:hypothetical protein GGR57DRAFT_504879 [Xylariaceae sp. FL1272]
MTRNYTHGFAKWIRTVVITATIETQCGTARAALLPDASKLPDCNDLRGNYSLNYIVSNWTGREHNGNETFEFDLATNFADFRLHCAGEINTTTSVYDAPAWNCTPTEIAEEPISATFVFRPDDDLYMFLNFYCQDNTRNGATATIDPPDVFPAQGSSSATIPLVRTAEGDDKSVSLTDPEVAFDILSMKIQARLPNELCSETSDKGTTAFQIKKFQYKLENYTWGIDGPPQPTTSESASFGFVNSANGWTSDCEIDGVAGYREDVNGSHFGWYIDPSVLFRCYPEDWDSSWGDAGYPFQRTVYNPATEELTVRDMWNCTDGVDGDEITYYAEGSKNIPLECDTPYEGVGNGLYRCNSTEDVVTIKAEVERRPWTELGSSI